MTESLALLVTTADEPGILAQLTRVFADHGANITHVDIIERGEDRARLYFEAERVSDGRALLDDLAASAAVRAVERTRPFAHIYGKRVIVIGGGAQVGQVMLGAVSEAGADLGVEVLRKA